ncbi:type II toxin-antitoxin system RelE family toxin [Mediterraneibacter gnavus]|jgi:mRNA interferase RelE/StbE|uniref:type II toxin-antitoxin system RelE family toxin n=1 Tax=Mediterraneibacter gnavus TaxID=33038 RepID=UPI000E51C91D|nr:type II toxin-antitoxin system RelE/ParE family toxin [Mediterraneibacter gnavus]RHI85583.1 type II toxin-antitoxin system RelE/ParE family toxin [Mediterraneibacter gnavus]
MRYQIVLEKPAQKFLKRLNRTDKERILRAIYKLPEGENIKRLKGHQDLLRLRVGDYRVIYTVNNGKLVVCVVDIGNRGDVYKRY